MTLSTAALDSESPNDRISTILEVMTSISERVDKLVGKVNNIDHMEELTAEKVFFPTFFLSLSFQSFW